MRVDSVHFKVAFTIVKPHSMPINTQTITHLNRLFELEVQRALPGAIVGNVQATFRNGWEGGSFSETPESHQVSLDDVPLPKKKTQRSKKTDGND